LKKEHKKLKTEHEKLENTKIGDSATVFSDNFASLTGRKTKQQKRETIKKQKKALEERMKQIKSEINEAENRGDSKEAKEKKGEYEMCEYAYRYKKWVLGAALVIAGVACGVYILGSKCDLERMKKWQALVREHALPPSARP
jgi:hypothetical protein